MPNIDFAERWKEVAKEMRAAGVKELQVAAFHIVLTDAAPPEEPKELKLDDNPMANAAALATMRLQVRKELEAEAAQDRERFRFAASEGIPT